MRRNRKTKIVATLGPASSSADMIHALFAAGVDVFRFNFSHGTHAQHQVMYAAVREVERATGRPIAVLVDLQGPKLRIGALNDRSVTLHTGEKFRLDLEDRAGDARRASLPHPEIFKHLKPGVELLLDDGKIRLVVGSCGPDWAETDVVVGGPLSERKGVTVVGAVLPLSPLTEKDRRDLAFALDMGADWIALSFVQRPQDMQELRDLVKGRAGVMAKIEKPAAMECLDEIVGLSDGIMVARGDLGVEMAPEKVPVAQRTILRVCRRAGTPVIVATQMLESMILAPTPTRAEVSDVATAIYGGTDAVMLSGESAVGKFPVEAVGVMSRTIQEVEQAPDYQVAIDAAHPGDEPTLPDAICAALRRATSVLDVAAAVTYTNSGSTSIRAARERLPAPIIGMSTKAGVARRLALVWGVHSVLVDTMTDIDAITVKACSTARDEGFVSPGQVIAITAGTPFGAEGTTNLLKLAVV